MEALLILTALLGLALVAVIVWSLTILEDKVSEITDKVDSVKLKLQAQGEKLVLLNGALVKIQADETTLLARIEALQAQIAELDPATLAVKIQELADLAQGNLETATAASTTAQEIDNRVADQEDPGTPA